MEMNMPRYLVSEVDFAYNQPLQDVLTSIRKHSGKIMDFDPNGPGGGNPCLALSFANEDDAFKFLVEHFPNGEDEQFLKDMITPI